MDSIVCCCRPGFETEAGQEIVEKAAALDVFGFFKPVFTGGLVFRASDSAALTRIWRDLHCKDLVFTRDWWQLIEVTILPQTDRVGAVVAALSDLDQPLPKATGRMEAIVPDGVDDPSLHRFAKKWTPPLSRALKDAGILSPGSDAGHRLELLLPGFDKVWLCWSDANNRAPFSAGVARLRQPPEAPSRSSLKLEEAWHVFFGRDQFLQQLGGGQQAVDLGAAPGGWTWQLVNQGMMVTAVDNGPMAPDLMASGHVTHVRADGFSWRPRRAVDWLVCDMVEQPRRVAALMVAWVREGLCRHAIFNLKLPMKQRYAEWQLCEALILDQLAEAGIDVRLAAKHLYHDREEITCYLERV